MSPGPSPLAPQVREALGRDIIHHRTEEFRNILAEVDEGLKYVFRTQSPVLTFASSGTGAMEAAISNFLSHQDKALVVVGGKFGERWKEICGSFKVKTVCLDIEWGQAPCVEKISEILKKDSQIRAVYTTLCETSTATVYDIKGIAQITKDKDILLVVDAISGLGQDVLETDLWGVDVVVGGCQKGFMLPPGLSFISLNKKAESFLKNSDLPKYYFDINKALKAYHKNDTPFTPAVGLIMALRESLRIIREEGIEARWQYFAKLSEAVRKSLSSLGLKLFSKNPSSSVTAVSLEDLDTQQIVKKMRSMFGISIAGGQSHLKGKIIRIAHMGYINEQDIVMTLSCLEKVLIDLGYKFDKGISLKTFQESFYP
ncbi:MAG TPA: alanine--glyoxylate aminotransferase family protein [Candidatus Omnitrophica bacterium]|nr:MAG: aminotransferase [Candidatus Omnitrophota bacterium]RKY35677.1 MAG: aminotransferase [Candidatus Omnitrophota bacterium]RKY44985.1 MAG: aminotransferase [Candidatus Omnitrophota bacterium]HEC69801.1 alanine--glyoxylate aminotransferase family protein [Candidatus Omnitrophota bacterium]